jgi:hypothetical protein
MVSKPERLEGFREVWCVVFEFERPPGERPTPLALTAREYRSGQQVRLVGHELAGPEPPYPLGPHALFMAYDAPAALGCHLSLGWPMPARVLDLHAEFRRATSGLLEPGKYDLAAALEHYSLAGEGVDGLEKLLVTMLPRLDLPRAVLVRGRYTAAVARMEATGIPLDQAAYERLRDGWQGVRERLIERVDRDYDVFRGGKFQPRRWQAWVNRHGIHWPRQAPGKLDLSLEAFKDMARSCPEVRAMRELTATLATFRPSGLAVGRDGRNRCPLRPFASKTGRNQPSTSQFIFGQPRWLRGLVQPAEGRALAYVDYEQQEVGIAAALSGDPRMREAYTSGDFYLGFARQAGAVPADATKRTHSDERQRFKQAAIAVQYGM